MFEAFRFGRRDHDVLVREYCTYINNVGISMDCVGECIYMYIQYKLVQWTCTEGLRESGKGRVGLFQKMV